MASRGVIGHTVWMGRGGGEGGFACSTVAERGRRREDRGHTGERRRGQQQPWPIGNREICTQR